jgi:hypothetical protein
MIRYRNHYWKLLAFYSLVGLAAGIFCFVVQTNPKGGITPQFTLLEASGKLAWMQEYKYGTRFGLVGIDKRFNYPSKASGMGVVRDSLKHSGDSIVSVRYETDSHGPVFSDEKYHNVWKLSVGNHTIRTYTETAEAWESDNRLAPWVGLAMTACGLVLGFASWLARRAAQQGAPADVPRSAGWGRG